MTNASDIFDRTAGTYDLGRRRLIPPFDSFYETAVTAVRLAGPAPTRILDLGAGTGLLSRMLRQEYPEAHLTLLDAAANMLEQARAALGPHNTSYVEGNLAAAIPHGPWDAIVSALAIHHLSDPDKRLLMARVREQLRPGGVFVNAEQVAGPSPRFADIYATWHEASSKAAGSDTAEWTAASERMRHDQWATVEDQLNWLRQAGFDHADCLFKEYRFAVLVALT